MKISGHAVPPIILGLTLVALVHLPVVLLVGEKGWDDGAITVAFARTLAETGQFALTPRSPVVEGSSSLLFAGMNALLHRVLDLSFHGALLASRALTAVCALAGCFLLARQIIDAGSSPRIAAILAALTFALPPFLAETANGMEMSLFAALLVAFAASLKRQPGPLTVVLLGLLLLTRFEAIFYLSTAFAVAFVVAPERRRQAMALLGATLALFALITVWRYGQFGELLPNTVMAKMNPPYSGNGTAASIFRRVEGVLEVISVLGTAVLLLGVLAMQRPLGPVCRFDRAVVAGLLVAALAFSVIAGKNWGYPGRMFLGFVPLVVLALVWGLTDRLGDLSRLLRPIPDAIVLTLVVLLATGAGNLGLAKAVIGTMAASLNARMPSPSLAKIEHVYKTIAGDITPASFRSVAEAVDDIRAQLGRETISFLTPDVGGSALCCPRIRILDIGGLASPEIARHGYAALPELLARERPDIANPHSRFAEAARIFDLAAFTEAYEPVLLDGHVFWLRSDHLATLAAQAPLERRSVLDLGTSGELRFVRYPEIPSWSTDRLVTVLHPFGPTP